MLTTDTEKYNRPHSPSNTNLWSSNSQLSCMEYIFTSVARPFWIPLVCCSYHVCYCISHLCIQIMFKRSKHRQSLNSLKWQTTEHRSSSSPPPAAVASSSSSPSSSSSSSCFTLNMKILLTYKGSYCSFRSLPSGEIWKSVKRKHCQCNSMFNV